ncbi:MAG: dethiobiotin synthase [Burkholderiales bacterium]
MSRGYFIAGTDTGVGKTLVSSALIRAFAAQGHRVVGMKPVAAGSVMRNGKPIWEDTEALMAASNITASVAAVMPYGLRDALAPHIAAEREHVSIEMTVIANAYQKLAAMADVVIVEGAGGLLVPLGDTLDAAEIPRALGLPVILVVGMRLGCLNHALLTQLAIAQRGLKLAGWVGSVIDPGMSAVEENFSTLKSRIAAPNLGFVPFLDSPDVSRVSSLLKVGTLDEGERAL